ncbi:MAG: hypothetical protein JW839_15725 [Candidatus Lokiarchaeota archaeon]|nr:hypothetical protein [Candidatus Lokiarchaeota archaeon]
MKRMQLKRDLGLAVLLVLGTACTILAASSPVGTRLTFHKNAVQSSAVVLNGNAAVDAYFAGNGTNGMSSATAHVLKDKNITPLGTNPRYCIALMNTNRYITIRNCTITGGSVQSGYGVIHFTNASHVYVTLCSINSNQYGVSLGSGSNFNTFFKNNVTSTFLGFNLFDSTGNTIYMNAIFSSTAGSASSDMTGNHWDDGTTGNYWSRYQQEHPSATHNGRTWNTPYNIMSTANENDTRPLVRSPFVTNVAPTLGVPTLSPGFTGFQNTQFTFQVTYTDPDDNAPISVSVVINGVTRAMSKVTPAEYTYSDGCNYRYIGYLQPGTYTFYCTCSDGLPASTVPYGPIGVTKTNAQAPQLTSVTALPATGDENTAFTFRVTYTDADNNAPTSITVTIDGTAHQMAKEDATDTDLMDGCWYTYTTTLDVGSHAFSMQCNDGSFSNSTATMQGPVVTLSAAGQAAQAATTAAIVIGIIAGCVVIFAALVIYREKLPPKVQRVIPERRVFSSAWDKTKTWFKGLGAKISTFFKGLGDKIRRH